MGRALRRRMPVWRSVWGSAPVVLALMLAGCGGGATASRALVIDQVAAQTAAPLNPASMALAVGGQFAERQSGGGTDLSPPLAWAATPGARAYAVVIEDPDAPGGAPFAHWLIWNIPGDAVGLPEGVAPGRAPPTPAGAVQGKNDFDITGYTGPRPPRGSGVHHYHVELFALSAPLALTPASRRQDLAGALQGHVLAKGQLIATYGAPR